MHRFAGYATDEPVPTLLQVLNGGSLQIHRRSKAKRLLVLMEVLRRRIHHLQQVLIDTSKEPFPKLLRDSVLTALGMTHSTYEQPLPQALQVRGHSLSGRRQGC